MKSYSYPLWHHLRLPTFFAGAWMATVSCTSREHGQTAATPSSSPEAATDASKPKLHLGPLSDFDNKEIAKGGKFTTGMGLVSSTEQKWVCTSRSEITACRGKNGTGEGQVLWLRYRGRLNEVAKSKTPIFARISVGSKFDSFPLSHDAFGSYLLLTDGLLFCSDGASSRIYEAGASSSCKNAPARMKTLMAAFPPSQDAKSADWKFSVQFGVTLQPTPKDKKRTEMDAGNPKYSFSIPAVIEGSEEEGPINPDDVPEAQLQDLPMKEDGNL